MNDRVQEGFAFHADLVSRMAGKLGLDLTRELDAGRISFDGMDDAVFRCMGCSDPEGCALWLEEFEGGAQEAPEICQNRALFKRLG